MGDGNFRPPTESTLLDHPQKFVASDYVGDRYGCAKFGANPSTGGFWEKWVKYNQIFFIYLFIPFFHELTYRSDPLTDFHA